MKTTLEIIQSRRSIKPMFFTGESIEDSRLEQLLLAAHSAANHKLTAPWRFKIFGPQTKSLFGEWVEKVALEHKGQVPDDLKQRMAMILSKSSHIIVIGLKPEPIVPEWEEVAALGGAIQNLHLAAVELNLGGFWSTGYPYGAPQAEEHLGWKQEGIQLMGFFYLGVPEQSPPKPPIKDIQTRVEWVR
jgi:nitroreductase